MSWKGIYSPVRHPENYSIRGIDISRYQGRINWSAARRSKIGDVPLSFVFMKATEGESLVDPTFQYNFSRAQDYGVLRGAYHYYIPGVAPQVQFENFINTVNLEAGDLPPVLDVESIGNLCPDELKRQVYELLQLLEKHYSATPILYTYHKFKKKYLNTPEFDRYHFWIAHYYVDTIKYDGEWRFWQYSDKGDINGINGDVDVNIFNGSMYHLQSICLKDTTKTNIELKDDFL